MSEIYLRHLEPHSPVFKAAIYYIVENHYLHTMPDPRTSMEVYMIQIGNHLLPGGFLVFGRPQATRCGRWYGDVDEAADGRCDVTRWQVLNLARVYILPKFQAGGMFCKETIVPGYYDRRGMWRSTLASTVIRLAVESIGYRYLIHRPPVYLDQPFEIRWLMSYCNTNLHKGVIYKTSGFELYGTNSDGIQTWRIRLPELTDEQSQAIQEASLRSKRAQIYRAKRSQLKLEL